MQADGNLVVYNNATPSRTAVWSSDTAPATSAILVMQDDGNLVIYSRGGVALWSSTGGRTNNWQDTLGSGQTLTAGESIVSMNGSYAAVMQGDGNFVVYAPGAQATWATGTGQAGNRIVMQGDGNLVVYDTSGTPRWSSGTAPSSNDRLVMQDDGNLVIYSRGGLALWASSGGRTSNAQDTLGTGQTLTAGESIVSMNGSYAAVMQGDGNFVVYAPGAQATWATGTGQAGNRIVMQGDGNLVVYDTSGTPRWSSGTAPSSNDRLVMQDDGNLVIYNGSGTAVWDYHAGALGGGDASDAVNWANAHNGEVYGTATEQPAGDHEWSGYCWTFVYDAFGGAAPRENTAQDAWNYYAAKGMTHSGAPPAGTIAFWEYGSEGHAAVAVGSGLTIGTHGTYGDHYAVEEVAYNNRGLTYLGWVAP